MVAFMNPGGIRTDLSTGRDAGVITFADAFAVQPFGNSLVTLTLTGAQIDSGARAAVGRPGHEPEGAPGLRGLTYTWAHPARSAAASTPRRSRSAG